MKDKWTIALAAVACALLLNLRSGRGQVDPTSAPGMLRAQLSPRRTTEAAPPPGVLMMSPPSTILESQAARKNTLVIKRFSEIGAVAGEDGSSVLMTAMEASIPDENEKYYGIQVHVAQPTPDAPLATVSYIDEEEIEGLARALDALGKLQEATPATVGFEGRYQTRGNLEFTNVNVSGSRVLTLRSEQLLVPTGQLALATASLRLSRIAELQQQLENAKQSLARMKGKEPAPPQQ
jgi:hypothetical protein